MPVYKPSVSKLILLIIMLCFATSSFSQSVISGTIRDYTGRKLVLSILRGDKQISIDSTYTNAEGSFTFHMPASAIRGMYLLKTSSGNSIRIIYNHKPVRLISGGFSDQDVIDFVGSDENRLWYDYYFLSKTTQYLQDLLKPILQEYPEASDFIDQARNEFNRLQVELHAMADKIIIENPNTLAAKFIQADLIPALDLKLSMDEQRQKLIQDFFMKVDFTDTTLIYSDILTRKMIDFLALHQRQGMSMAELQIAFMKGIDVILSHASTNDRMYVFAVTYLIRGFSGMGMNVVSDYLSTLPHLNISCMEPAVMDELQQSILPYQKIVVGAPAPDINTIDIQGNPFNLNEIKSGLTVILFWSTTCPHCLELLPELKKLAADKNILVVSVVIGPNDKTLRDLIDAEKLNWIHIADSRGWEAPWVNDYVVFATPTMFLINKDKTIVGKPINIEELQGMMPLK